MRSKAKRKRAQAVLDDKNASEIDKLEAEADIVEMDAFKEQGDACYDQAVRERAFIDGLIEQVKPYRKFADLPEAEAHQLAQQEEWKHELIFRAQNFLGSQGFIPHDHLATMRMHPAWESELFPKIQKISKQILEQKTEALPNKSLPTPLLDTKTTDVEEKVEQS